MLPRPLLGVDGPCSRVLSWSPRVPVSSSHQGTCPHGWGSSLGHRLTWLTPVKALSPDSKMLGVRTSASEFVGDTVLSVRQCVQGCGKDELLLPLLPTTSDLISLGKPCHVPWFPPWRLVGVLSTPADTLLEPKGGSHPGRWHGDHPLKHRQAAWLPRRGVRFLVRQGLTVQPPACHFPSRSPSESPRDGTR